MTRDIPIIFSSPMVRGLLEGRKTMTRRIVSLSNCEFGSILPGKNSKLFWQHADWKAAWPDRGFPDADGVHRHGYLHVPCHANEQSDCEACFDRGWDTTTHRLRPKVQAGERLWVRESGAFACRTAPIYRADGEQGGWKWRPSIHMPRWASRLTLIVKAVKIERVQDIPLLDVWAEGCEVRQFWLFGADGPERQKIGARMFGNLWEKIHGRDSWDANPFVVATTFRVIKANIDAPEARIAA